MQTVAPTPIDAGLPQEERDFIIQSALEAAHLPNAERAEQRDVVGALIGEIATHGQMDLAQREGLLALFDENIRIARGEIKPQDKIKGEDQKSADTRLTVNADEVHWLSSDAEITLQELVTPNGTPYLWGDISKLSPATRKYIPEPAIAARLITSMQKHVGTFIDERHGHSSSLRREAQIRTTWGAYKDDNLANNEYRGLLLRTAQEGKDVFLMAAVFNHTNQAKVMTHLMKRSYAGK